jgi:hypothetical protein
MDHSFLADPPGAGGLLRHENAVCHRQIRGGVTVEDELVTHGRCIHPRGSRRRPDERNSVNAWATVAEIVTPDRAARRRTRAAREAGSFTVNTTLSSGTGRRPVAEAWST